MGCGSSTAAKASAPIEKDPEDFHLNHVDFKKMKVPKFDDFLDEVEIPVNQVVDISNEINDIITDIKDATAILVGAFKVEFKDVTSVHDTVFLTLTKADGTPATPADVEPLLAKAKAADDKLAKAKDALYDSAPTGLSVAGDVLTGSGVEAFNAALAELRTAVGAEFKIAVAVKSGFAGPAVTAMMAKPVFPDPESPNVDWYPVGVLEVAKTKEAKNIGAAELAVADAAVAVAKAAKAAEEGGITSAFSIKKKKLQVKLEGGEGEDAADKKSAVRKAVSTFNTAAFKLHKSCININGPVNVATAVVKIFESLKAKAEKLAKEAGKEAMNVIKVEPKISMGDDFSIEFDMDVKINLPDWENKNWVEMLPGPAEKAWTTVMDCKAKIVDLVPKFTELKESVEQLIEKTDETFSEPTEAIKEAFPDANVMDIAKAATAAAQNLVKIKEGVKVVQVFIQTVKRIYDELQKAVDEVKVKLQ